MNKKRPKIIYIAGAGHSGSTLLDIVLSSNSSAFGAGELKFLRSQVTRQEDKYKSQLLDDSGAQLSESVFWGDLIHNSQAFIRPLVRTSDLSFFQKCRFVWSGKSKPLLSDLGDEYLFSYIAQKAQTLTGSKIDYIIDSSKTIGRLGDLLQNTSYDVYVIYLLRDVRGVAYSYKRRKNIILRPIWEWFITNVLVKTFVMRVIAPSHRIFVYYDDFVAKPHKYLDAIEDMCGLRVDLDTLVNTVQQKSSYRFAGNEMRHREFAGIRPDQSWKENLSGVCRIVLAPLNKIFMMRNNPTDKLLTANNK